MNHAVLGARAKRVQTTVLALAAAVVLSGILSASAQAAWPTPGVTESSPTGVTQNPTFPNTVATDVTVDAPLPASFGPHPAACDKLHFLRIRYVGGPSDPANADKILTAQPGILEGASAFYNIGGDVVTRAKSEQNKYVEFWAVDRRPNCLEDVAGLKLAKQSGDPTDMINYYYKGKSVDGKRFGGYLNPTSDAAWLSDMGMAQTNRDWYSIITKALPDQSVRQSKLYCGGHSLGGFITGNFADTDFDGNPATTADAGYNQCAGYFALDTQITAAPLASTLFGSDLAPLLGDIPSKGLSAAMRAGLFERFIDVPGVLNPEVMYLLTGIGVAADLKPTTESNLIKQLPINSNIRSAYSVYFSKNLPDYLAQTVLGPSMRNFRFTNQALLGTFMDDNAMPLSIVQASAGFYKGGSVQDKDFPLPGDLPSALSPVTGLLSSPNLAIPNNSGIFGLGAPLYGWADFNQVGSMTIPKNSNGQPYTSPGKEVTSISDLARAVGAYPLNFIEAYFPFALAGDALLGSGAAAHPEGVSARPTVTITAGDGPKLASGVTNQVVLPGYNHIDVLTASPVQNNGQPEGAATALLGLLYP